MYKNKTRITKKELLKKVELHEKWRKGEGGECLELENCDLTGHQFGYRDLCHAKFINCDFSETDIYHTLFEDCDFRFSNFKNASIYKADLRGANFMFCNLEGANLCDALIIRTNLSACNLTSANLSGANLQFVDLNSSNLKDVIIDKETRIYNCGFSGVTGLKIYTLDVLKFNQIIYIPSLNYTYGSSGIVGKSITPEQMIKNMEGNITQHKLGHVESDNPEARILEFKMVIDFIKNFTSVTNPTI